MQGLVPGRKEREKREERCKEGQPDSYSIVNIF